jgi:hypothetical protein
MSRLVMADIVLWRIGSRIVLSILPLAMFVAVTVWVLENFYEALSVSVIFWSIVAAMSLAALIGTTCGKDLIWDYILYREGVDKRKVKK